MSLLAKITCDLPFLYSKLFGSILDLWWRMIFREIWGLELYLTKYSNVQRSLLNYVDCVLMWLTCVPGHKIYMGFLGNMSGKSFYVGQKFLLGSFSFSLVVSFWGFFVIAFITRYYPFSAYAYFSEKLILLTHWP